MLERYVSTIVLFIVAALQYGVWAQLPPIIQHSDYDAMEQHYAGTELGDGSELVRLSLQYINQPTSSLAGCIMDAVIYEEECGVNRFGAVAVFPRTQKKVEQSSGSKYIYFNVESEKELENYDEATLSTKLFHDRCILNQYSKVDISSKNCISARNMTIEVKNPDGHVYTGPRGKFRKELLHTTRAFGQEVGLSSGVIMTILKEEDDKCLVKIVRDDNNYTHQGIVFWCSGRDIRNQTTVFNTFLETVKEDAQKVAKALEKVRNDKNSEREMIREIISDTNSTTTNKQSSHSIEDANLQHATSVQSGNTGPHLSLTETEFNFGTLRSTERVSHDFVVRNEGGSSLTLHVTRKSAHLDARIQNFEIGPNETTTVGVELDLRGRDGIIRSIVAFETNDPDHPQFELIITGRCISTILVDPMAVNFGVIARGSESKARVRVKSGANGVQFTLMSIEKENLDFIKYEINTITEKEDYGIDLSIKSGTPTGSYKGKLIIKTDSEDRKIIWIPISIQIL